MGKNIADKEDKGEENKFELSYARFLFFLEARTSAALPPYLGSALRGVLGRAFREIACLSSQKSCEGCMFITRCAYAYVFETNRYTVPEDTGHRYIPHPFILEPPLERRTRFAPGEELAFNLILLGHGLAYLPYFIASFQMLDKLGLGAERYPFSLLKVEQCLEKKQILIWQGGNQILEQPVLENLSSYLQQNATPTEMTLELKTPTRLVFAGKLASSLDFPVLLRALFRRLGLLGGAHGQWPLQLPFQELLNEAAFITQVKTDITWQEWERYSTRQRTKLQMGGLIGSTLFRGNFQPFLPYLHMGEIVHVGKGTVFGLGKMSIRY